MIKEIDDLLSAWAMWTARREDGGTGWRGSSLNSVMAQACREYGYEMAQSAQIADLDMMSVERVVMHEISPESRAVVTVCYRGRGTYAQKARDLGCSKSTLSLRMHNAHIEVASALDHRWLVAQGMAMIRATKNQQSANDHDLGY